MSLNTNAIHCDSCNKIIKSKLDAFVEWIEEDGTFTNVKVVHKSSSSPDGACCSNQIMNTFYKSLELSEVYKYKGLAEKLGLPNINWD